MIGDFLDSRLPRFRGQAMSLEVASTDSWWKPIMDKLFPNGIRRSGDPHPEINVAIEIEGITKHFVLDGRQLEEIQYQSAICSTVFHFRERREFE